MDISVIICTHNPREDYLRRVLDALARQTLPRHHWELLLIDNASTEPLDARWDLSWHPHARHVREEELGLTPARLRGIREATAPLLVFVDDDNVLAPDYFELAIRLHEKHPHLAVIGSGCIRPEFEVPAPAPIHPNLPLLALRDFPSPRWSNNPHDWSANPCGAGLCLRRELGEPYAALLLKMGIGDLIDRNGKHLFAGGDDLFSWVASQARCGFGVFPELKIIHLIPSARLRCDYFIQLNRGSHLSQTLIDYMLLGKLPNKPPKLTWLRLLHIALHQGIFAFRFHRASFQGARDAQALIRRRGLAPFPNAPT